MDRVKLINPEKLKIILDKFAADGLIKTLQDVKNFIDSMPNAYPSHPRAAWIPVDAYNPSEAVRFVCSHCGCEISNNWDYDNPDDMWNYCPCCGAKMGGDE